MPHVVCSLEAPCRRPFDVRGLLEFFAVRALPGVEVVDTERLLYCRTIDLARLLPVAPESGPCPGVLQVDFGGSRMCAEVRATAGGGLESCREEEVERRVRRLFDLDANPDAIRSGLSDHSELASGGQSPAGVRIPGAWCRFETAVRAVLGQQISVAGARTLAGRLVAALGAELPESLRTPGLERTFPLPERVAAFDLRTIGLPASRAQALRAMAAEVAAGRLRMDAEPAEVRERLLAIKGIGPWTVEYVAMRALGDADAFPASDLGLRKAVNPDEPPSAVELEAMAESWRPLRAYAAISLWRRGGGG
ncbi:MAG: DNA-3-methyladenine glycosylase 2 family protein [Holophagales bacterium]|nr:DNA-3-methyladenine glycosylase 2 family protein [Holophagales bacterium]MYF95865.1 DNA-3-methyladenine glycosylase 2 family protein [Holophagales bacterium]